MIARRVAGETFLVPIRGDVADLRALYALNPVGSFIWDLLDGTRDVASLSGAVVDEFDVEEPRAAADLREILETFDGYGFIEDAA